METTKQSGARLQKLKGSNYEIADGEPDIRGWDVKDTAGKTIGEVEELIFDVQSRKVRYMVVDLDDNDFDLEERDVLIPIGLGELHTKEDDVLLPGVTAEQLKALPEYKGDDITQDNESTIRNVFAGVGAVAMGTAGLGDDFYSHAHFDEDNLFKNRRSDAVADGTATIPIIEEELQVGKRTVETGGAYIKSRIVERPVEETVNLKEEQVYVERTPADRPVSSTDFDNFKEGVIELNEYAEVPVVAKNARVVEEVTVGKDVQERDETIRETVRKTEVDIEDLTADRDTTKNIADSSI